MSLALSRQQLLVLVTTAATIFALMMVRYWVGIIPGYDRVPENLALSGPIVVAALGVCLVGGWVIANARSSNIDVREKMNQTFAYPVRPLFQIFLDAIKNEERPMRVFADEDFKQEMVQEQIDKKLFRIDSVPIQDPVTYEITVREVKNDLNFADIKRYRVKEIWYFDKQSSTQKVRILGIAPLIQVKSDQGGTIGETPLFWVYYPEAREYLVNEMVFNPANDASQISWEDLMEMRYFSSYIIKVSNVGDQRLQNQFGSGRDMLLESEKLKQSIFNYENDLWVH
jgi:gliding motility associated protien GldN